MAAPATTEIVKTELTVAQKFAMQVQKRFIAEMGEEVPWTPLQMTLGQHMYLGIDKWMKAHNADQRNTNNQMAWDRIDQTQLAIDTTSRVAMELDAMIPNHISPVPYNDSKSGLVKLDLRIGYEGILYTRCRFAIDPPVAYRIELIHENDTFKRTVSTHYGEGFEFEEGALNRRGEAIAGFVHLAYHDKRKDRVIVVDAARIKIARDCAQTKAFWDAERSKQMMIYKTVITAAFKKLPLDPRKINSRVLEQIAASENEFVFAEVAQDALNNANGPVLSLSEAEDELNGVQPAVLIDPTTGESYTDPNPDEKIGTPPASEVGEQAAELF